MRRKLHTACSIVIALLIVVAGALLPRGDNSADAMTFSGLSNDVSVKTYTVGTGVFLVLPGSGHVLQNLTFTQTANATIVPGNWIGQFMILNVCQDSTGGWTPGFNHTVGVVIKGSFPTFTTTANKCDMVGLIYVSNLTWQITGIIQNE